MIRMAEQQVDIVGISASKVVGLIGTLFAFASGLSLMFTPDIVFIICGIVVFVLSILLMIAINVFGLNMRRNIPYEWWFLLLIALGLFVFYIILFNVPFVRAFGGEDEEGILGSVISNIQNFLSASNGGSEVPILFASRILLLLSIIFLTLACILRIMSEKNAKVYNSSKVVVLTGVIWAIVESIILILSSNVFNIIIGVIGIILALLLILSIPPNIKLPYTWWFVLIIGFIYFILLSPYFEYTIISGALVLVGFVLILMAY